MRSRARLVFAFVVGALPWLACVGNDPDAAPPAPTNAGERGGPCNKGKCLVGLTCVDSLCVELPSDAQPTNTQVDSGGGGGNGGKEDAESSLDAADTGDPPDTGDPAEVGAPDTSDDGAVDGSAGDGSLVDASGGFSDCFNGSVQARCGPNRDCCESLPVPGGSYNRLNNPQFPATIRNFRLDTFEVTVARFRAFVNAGKGTQADAPGAGEGKHTSISGSGWDVQWTQHLPINTPGLVNEITSCGPRSAYSSTVAHARETLAMNCVSWYVAFAFCIWDGGWLPTEAEWNYAASGGDEHRKYPWGSTHDGANAAYSCTGDNSTEGDCAVTDLAPVGSRVGGAGRWGHLDLASSAWEWTLDTNDAPATDPAPFGPAACDNCAHLQTGPERVLRGGSFVNSGGYHENNSRTPAHPINSIDYHVGFRCGR